MAIVWFGRNLIFIKSNFTYRVRVLNIKDSSCLVCDQGKALDQIKMIKDSSLVIKANFI